MLLGQVSKPSSRDWPTQNYDLAGTRYSPLRQIDSTNVSKLKQVWTYRLRSDERPPFTASEAVLQNLPWGFSPLRSNAATDTVDRDTIDLALFAEAADEE